MPFEDDLKQLMDEGKFAQAAAFSVSGAVHYLNIAAAINFQNLNDHDQAARWMSKAIELEPGNGLLYSNLAYILGRARKLEEAVLMAKKGIEIVPDLAELHYNLGVILADLGRTDEAIAAYRRAIELKNDYPIVHFNLGSLLIQQGRFKEGLAEYEWRFKSHDILIAFRKRFDKPDWDGQADLKGKRLLVYNEQGCGDAVQFCRLVPKLKERGAYVITEVQEELGPLMAAQGWCDKVVTRSHQWQAKPDLPEHDYIVSYSSLAHLLDIAVTNVPNEVPYLKVTPKKVKSNLIGVTKLNVGIVWAGSIWHPNDNNRSMEVGQFLPLASVPNVRLYSLQKGPMERRWDNDQVDLMRGAEKLAYVDLGPYLQDFNVTANFIQKLDLVISVDTTIAHLAGALGKKVWLLLPERHDWRWLQNRPDSPWYPTMRIFRQTRMGDWASLMQDVKQQLEVEARKKHGPKAAKRTSVRRATKKV